MTVKYELGMRQKKDCGGRPVLRYVQLGDEELANARNAKNA
jgi:hypothetical protein